MANTMAAVGVPVSDLKRSVDFYTRVMGMKKLQDITLDVMDEAIVGYPGGVPIVLMWYKDGVKRNIGDFAGKLVFYLDDMKSAIEAIRKEGLAITREPAEYPGFGMIGFGTDPDGYQLELIQQK